MKRHINDFSLVHFRCGANWQVRHHQLFDIDPNIAGEILGFPKGITIWDTHFVGDLFLAENQKEMKCVAVGWVPYRNPTGHFYVALFQASLVDDVRRIDWDHPTKVFQSRSIDEVVSEIQSLLLARLLPCFERWCSIEMIK